MAKNSGGKRVGPVKNRSQFYNRDLERWVKRDAKTGRILGVKADKKPYKGVRREKEGR